MAERQAAEEMRLVTTDRPSAMTEIRENAQHRREKATRLAEQACREGRAQITRRSGWYTGDGGAWAQQTLWVSGDQGAADRAQRRVESAMKGLQLTGREPEKLSIVILTETGMEGGPSRSAAWDRAQEAVTPMYDPTDAATQIGIPETTIRRWMRSADGARQGLRPAQYRPLKLSFANLVELVTAAWIKQEGVTSAVLWSALQTVGRTRGLAPEEQGRPLSLGPVLSLYARTRLLEALGRHSVQGATGLRKAAACIVAHRRAAGGIPAIPERIVVDGLTSLHPETRWGETVIIHTREPLDDARARMRMGEDLEELATEFRTPIPVLKRLQDPSEVWPWHRQGRDIHGSA